MQTKPVEIARRLYEAVMSRAEKAGFHLFLVELGDDNPDIPMPELPAGYSTQVVSPESLLDYVGPEYDLSEEFLRGAISRGDRCVANYYFGKLVGYGFVTRERAPVTGQVQVVVDHRLVYRYKGWTHPEHRRKHLSHARGRINSRVFPLQPGQRMVSYVATHNFASKLKHRDVHPVRIGFCGYVRLFGREYPFTHRIPRRFGFRLEKAGG